MASPSHRYLRRDLAELLRSATGQFPSITLTSPRQAGKTTRLKRFFEPDDRYVSVDRPDARKTILADPRGFFHTYPPPVFFGELQTAPELMPYIREHVDEHRSESAQFILSGSNKILLSKESRRRLPGGPQSFVCFHSRSVSCTASRTGRCLVIAMSAGWNWTYPLWTGDVFCEASIRRSPGIHSKILNFSLPAI